MRWWVCGLLLLATTLNYMDRVALNQTAGRIKLVFGLNDDDYALLESAFAVAFGLGTLACGWLVDRVSVRWVYPLVVLGWSVAGFLTGYANSFTMLLCCRVMLGGFEAGNWPCGIRTTRQLLPPEQRAFGNSLFQSGTAIGAILTPLIVIACLGDAPKDDPEAWRGPFRIIGLLGLVWVAAWCLTVPGEPLRHVAPTPQTKPFSAVLADRRFWVLVAVIVGVNSVWHTVRVWMPLYLDKQLGLSERDMNRFTIAYYVCADLGSWGVGLGAILFAKFGVDLHRARLALFAACVLLVLLALALPFIQGASFALAILLAVAFGALGLFPTYFALSQELSAAHQGKVTGTLGFLNALWLALMFRAEGRYATLTGRYDELLAVSGLPALAALLLLAWFWPPKRREPRA